MRSARSLLAEVSASLTRASALAMGRTAPNPAVAATLLAGAGSDRQLFEGATEPPGRRHAEVVALDAFGDGRPSRSSALGSLPEAAGMYVTLEPCSRHGRTPPCTDRIIATEQVRRVAFGLADPLLGGEGHRQLRDAGTTIRRPRWLSGLARPFLAGFEMRGRGHGPRYHIKFALTADGRMAREGSATRLLISGAVARSFTMLLRAKLDAVLVGPGTVALDRPGLDLRMSDWPADAFAGLRPLSGDDALTDAWLAHEGDLRSAALDEAEYQPRRIALVAGAFAGEGPWLERQKGLAEATGRPLCLLPTGSDAASQRGRQEQRSAGQGLLPGAPLPALSDSAFASSLRGQLGELGLNDVLIEGGAGLFAAIEGDLRSGDRLYVLQSRTETNPVAPAKADSIARADARIHRRGVRPPAAWSRIPVLATYDLGEDLLRVHELP